MKIVVGLGNIGKEYINTRHNMGFIFLDILREKYNLDFKEEKKFKGLVADHMIGDEKVIFLKPTTYMNASGESLFIVANFYKVLPKDILIISDDLDTEFGDYRFKGKGRAGGQNGLKNIFMHLGTEKVPRLKLGIGPKKEFMDARDFVLSKFSKSELKELKILIDSLVDALECFVKNGIEEAMNSYNGKK